MAIPIWLCTLSGILGLTNVSRPLVHRKGEYCGETLNQHLTKEQIQEIELTIIGKLFSMVKG